MSNILLKPYVLDNGLAALASGATHVYICSTVPTTYTEATSTYAIGSKSLGAGNVFGAPQAATPNGRKIISAAVSGGTVTGTAVTPVCFAVVDSVNTRLLAVGEMTGAVAVTAGGSWGLGSYPITLPIAPVEIGATAWNPADVSSGLTLSGGNLTTATTATAAFEATRSVDAVTANQKIYFEIVVNSIVSGDALRFGVTNSTASPPNTIPNGDFAALTYSPGAGYAGFDDTTSPDHGTPVFIGTAVTNDVIGIAYDSANQTFWGRLNSGIWNNSGSADPATNTGGFAVVMGGAGSIKALAELISESGSTVQATTRFASSDWTLGAPSSFTEIAS